jgi:hypothetical protein
VPARRTRPLWECDICHRRFANRNQVHFCSDGCLEDHFTGSRAEARPVFDALVAAIREFGDVLVLPEKSRIAFQTRMSFAAVQTRTYGLTGHLVLARRTPSSKFTRIESFSARNHVHYFRLTSAAEIDAEFRALLKEAYAVGEQRHLAG